MAIAPIIALLGKNPEIALFELDLLAKRYGGGTTPFAPPYFVEVNFDQSVISPQEFLDLSGGTVKLYQLLETKADDPAIEISQHLVNQQQSQFSLSSIHSHLNLKTMANQIRVELKKSGLKPHFKILIDPFYSAEVTHNFPEFSLLHHQEKTVILAAIAAQNIDHWSKKDYGRPAFDPRSGMLPPKVARIMINLALSDKLQKEPLLLDPMCGSGTIVLEALDLNLPVIGSDISQKAVSDTLQNVDWFKQQFNSSTETNVFLADVTHLTQKNVPNQVDAIVFEGYLGPPHPENKNIDNLKKGLSKLYKGVLKNLYSLMKPGSFMVCALPEFHTKQGVKNLDDLVDWSETLGYTRCARFTYGRQHAFVKRAIYVLQKKEQ